MTPRAQVKKICLALPETTEERTGRHAAYLVSKKKFAYYLDDHHGDGRLAVTTRAPGENTALVESHPDRYFIPSYIGPRGWVGLYLDVGGVDRDEVDELVVDSYLLVAPNRLAALVDTGSA